MIILKILSGPFTGMEYSLPQGDSVLQLVGDVASAASGLQYTLAGAENIYLVAADHEIGRLIIRVEGPASEPFVSAAVVHEGTAGAAAFLPLEPNQPVRHLGLYFAVAPEGSAWSQDVMQFCAPDHNLAPADAERPAPLARRRSALLPWALVAIGAVAVTIGLGISQWQQPQRQAQRLQELLQRAPSDLSVVADEHGALHVFAADDAAQSWAQRALLRDGRWQAQVHVVSSEQFRVEQWLVQNRFPPVVVRLDDPRQPEIVLSGAVSAQARESLIEGAKARLPYAHRVIVTGVSDESLVRLARDELRTLGIETRVDIKGGRTSISNAAFLDDAALKAMTAFSTEFHHRWGSRRITIVTRLWDDLLKGRSFQYGPGEVIAFGDGRWDYVHSSSN